MVEAETTAPPKRRRRRRLRWLGWAGGALALLLLALLIAFNVSPRPGTWVIRSVFESDAAKVKRAMEAHAPPGIPSITDETYRSGDDDARLDVYFPNTVEPAQRLPTVVWTHGGAWISGHKDDAAPYFQLIAADVMPSSRSAIPLLPARPTPPPSTR